jgi:flagellar biosynthetic protein FliO
MTGTWLVALASAPDVPPPGADGPGVARSLLAMLVVFGLLGVLAWLARRGSLAPFGRRQRGGAIAVQTAVPLGDRRALAVVSVEGRRLLLGLTPAQVTLITELSAQPPPPFAETLDRSLTPPGERAS